MLILIIIPVPIVNANIHGILVLLSSRIKLIIELLQQIALLLGLIEDNHTSLLHHINPHNRS
jgi:hypothetical protein